MGNSTDIRAKRVVITGMAAITPFGIGIDTLWENLVKGRSGIRQLSGFDEYDFPIKIGGQLPNFNFEEYLNDINIRKIDPCSVLGLATAGMVLKDAGLDLKEEKNISVILGSGFGPCAAQEEGYSIFFLKGWRKGPPLTLTKAMYNNLASMVSIYYKLTGGHHIIAAACASGSVAIGRAYQLIKFGVEKCVLTGGADKPFIPGMFAAWILLRILSRNPDPQTACRPFDKNRDGLIISEGSAMLLLEELESAKERKAKIYGEIIGYGESSDAFHIAQPNSQGETLAIKKALEDANLNPQDIDYINAHGTSTVMNDKTETKAIKEIFKEHSYKVPVSSNKSMLGHSMGASGAIETIATALTIRNGIIPPTVNYEVPDPECDLDYVPNSSRRQSIKTALSNSFAFGGNNSVLVLKEYEGG